MGHFNILNSYILENLSEKASSLKHSWKKGRSSVSEENMTTASKSLLKVPHLATVINTLDVC